MDVGKFLSPTTFNIPEQIAQIGFAKLEIKGGQEAFQSRFSYYRTSGVSHIQLGCSKLSFWFPVCFAAFVALCIIHVAFVWLRW